MSLKVGNFVVQQPIFMELGKKTVSCQLLILLQGFNTIHNFIFSKIRNYNRHSNKETCLSFQHMIQLIILAALWRPKHKRSKHQPN